MLHNIAGVQLTRKIIMELHWFYSLNSMTKSNKGMYNDLMTPSVDDQCRVMMYSVHSNRVQAGHV